MKQDFSLNIFGSNHFLRKRDKIYSTKMLKIAEVFFNEIKKMMHEEIRFDRELQFTLLAVQGIDVRFMDHPSFHHPHFSLRIHAHTEH